MRSLFERRASPPKTVEVKELSFDRSKGCEERVALILGDGERIIRDDEDEGAYLCHPECLLVLHELLLLRFYKSLLALRLAVDRSRTRHGGE